MISIDKLNRAASVDWAPASIGQCTIDPVKVRDYLNKFTNINHRTIAETIVQKMRYVHDDELIRKLRETIAKVLSETTDKYTLLIPAKFGSESWLIQRCWDLLRHRVDDILIAEGGASTESTKFLLIDDAIYSGNNLTSIIDDTIYDKQVPPQSNFTVIVPYGSRRGIQQIKDIATWTQAKVHIEVGEVVEALRDYLNITESAYQEIADAFKMEFHPLPIYFDHKIANEFGSFPQILFEGYVPGVGDTKCLFSGRVPYRKPVERLKAFYETLS